MADTLGVIQWGDLRLKERTLRPYNLFHRCRFQTPSQLPLSIHESLTVDTTTSSSFSYLCFSSFKNSENYEQRYTLADVIQRGLTEGWLSLLSSSFRTTDVIGDRCVSINVMLIYFNI